MGSRGDRNTPQQRARLADAIVRLRDQGRINHRQAAYAMLDLHTKSTRLVAASLLEAVAVQVGAHGTPGGLHIAAYLSVFPGKVG